MQQIAGDPATECKPDIQKVATIFANTYYTGLYDDRAKYFAENAPYCHHNGVVYNGREAFVSFGQIEKIVIRSINSVLAAPNNILVQVTGHYRLTDDYEFAESFILSSVGDKHYVISAGCFKWVDKCPPGFRCSLDESQDGTPVIIENVTQNGIHTEKLDNVDQPIVNGIQEVHHNGTNGTNGTAPKVLSNELDQAKVADTNEIEDSKNSPEDNTDTEAVKDADATPPKSFSVVHVGDFKMQKKPPNNAIVTDLKKHFATYGKVRHINIPRKVIHGDIPLYLFVEFNDGDASTKIFSESIPETRGSRQCVVQQVNFPTMKYSGTITISEARPGYNNDEYRPSSKNIGKVGKKDTDEKIVAEKRTILSTITSEHPVVPHQKPPSERNIIDKKPADNVFTNRRSFPPRFKNESGGIKELTNGNSTVTGKSNNPGATTGRNRYNWDEKNNRSDLSKVATKNF